MARQTAHIHCSEKQTAIQMGDTLSQPEEHGENVTGVTSDQREGGLNQRIRENQCAVKVDDESKGSQNDVEAVLSRVALGWHGGPLEVLRCSEPGFQVRSGPIVLLRFSIVGMMRDQALFNCICRKPGNRVDVEFLHNVASVLFDGFGADEKKFSNLFIVVPLSDKL